MSFDSWLSVKVEKDGWFYGFLRNFYAQLTEKPAKLWPMLIPLIYRRITKENIVRVTFAIGLGFGVGEAWNVAELLPKEVVNQHHHIEGRYGTGKRWYGLECIKARRNDTSKCWITAIFFVMNLPLFFKSIGSSFLYLFEYLLNDLFECYGQRNSVVKICFCCSLTFSVNPI